MDVNMDVNNMRTELETAKNGADQIALQLLEEEGVCALQFIR
jgi:hypothetical protein